MIRKLTGLVDKVYDDGAVIDVHGVGYYVHAPRSTIEHLSPIGQPVTLWISTAMSDHAIMLYGFASAEDLEWFHLLTSVHGVGNRVALAILGVLSIDDLSHAIISGEGAYLTTVPGIGKKLVQRILIELKDKLPEAPAQIVSVAAGASMGAVSALVNLGYSEHRARAAVGKVMAANSNQPGASGAAAVEEIIRACLQELAR